MQKYNKAIYGTVTAFLTTLLVQWLTAQGVTVGAEEQAGIAAIVAGLVGSVVYFVENREVLI